MRGQTPAATGQGPLLILERQDHEELQAGLSVLGTPLRIGDRRFAHGLGTHAVSVIRVVSPQPIARFTAWAGVDHNDNTGGERGTVTFTVSVTGKEAFRTGVMRPTDPARPVDVDCGGARQLTLHVGDGGDGPGYDHADWADARIVLTDGTEWWLDQLPISSPDMFRGPWPFSFTFDGRSCWEVLPDWLEEVTESRPDPDRTVTVASWQEPGGGLRVTCELVVYAGFPAADWLLHFENTGSSDTAIVSDVYACDVVFDRPRADSSPYLVHRTRGGTPDRRQFEPGIEVIDRRRPRRLWAGNGRSSTEDLPFFKVEMGGGAAIFAIGWSGCWRADLVSRDDRRLRVTAGLDRTHFRLRPGERIRSPRILLLCRTGDGWEANARFRELIYRHYCARRSGQPMLPMLFCNTCFTRGGAWLNECNAQNQISLIEAYAPLRLEALLTDAGWFRGGWPNGAGNWDPRPEAYPEGMGPVAAAAQARGMIYGLWFEPERVVAGTDLHRQRPEWLLRSRESGDRTFLLNFGLPEVQEYFFNIVKGFMELPGFRFYRQDFNMDPLPYWRFSDAPDRQGITESRYIAGLYAFGDRIAAAWPDSVREGCASGGHRIDLETVMRMHFHQKTDYWFDDEVDQAALWGAGQYLPNNAIVAHLNNLTEYSFHSTLASSLCLGWIADAADFDREKAARLTERYLAVRHLLVGAWYPLLAHSRDLHDWTGMQYHRSDLDEGMLLVFRRRESPYPCADVSLRGLNPDGRYELVSDAAGPLGTFTGSELAGRFRISLAEPHRSDLIVYRRR